MDVYPSSPAVQESVSWVTIVFSLLKIAGGITLLGFLLKSMVVITKEPHLNMIQRFGKHHRVARPGFSLKGPFPLDRVVGSLSKQIQQIKVDVTIITSDKANLIVPVVVQYRVMHEQDESARKAFYELSDVEHQISAYVENIARSKGNKMTMTEIFQSTNEIKDAIKSSLDEQFEQYGYDIVDAQVTDPQPSAKVKEAFDDVIASQQRKAAAENDAEALKIKMVGSANAEAKSVEIKTETFKRQRTAIAETIKGLVEDLKPTGVSADRALSYLEGIDYRDTIRDASVNPGTTILLPMNMTDVAKATAINEALKN